MCPVGSSSVAGLAFQFYTGGPYPPEYDGALFFADYSRDCIWVMHRNGDVLPNPSNIKTFVGGAANPVDLQIGPGGDLFYADFDGGTIRRISFTAQNQPYRGGDGDAHQRRCPSDVNFDGTRSSDPDPGDTLSYAWDLDGTGRTTIRRRRRRRTPTRSLEPTRRVSRSKTTGGSRASPR